MPEDRSEDEFLSLLESIDNRVREIVHVLKSTPSLKKVPVSGTASPANQPGPQQGQPQQSDFRQILDGISRAGGQSTRNLIDAGKSVYRVGERVNDLVQRIKSVRGGGASEEGIAAGRVAGAAAEGAEGAVAGAAEGAAAAGEGAAVAGAAGAGAAGGAGAVVGGVVLVGVALVECGKAMKKFADGVLEENAKLAQYSANMAQIMAQIKVQEILQSQRVGNAIASQTGQQFANSQMAYNRSHENIDVLWGNVKNSLATGVNNVLAALLKPLNEIAGGVNSVAYGKINEKKPENWNATEFFNHLAKRGVPQPGDPRIGGLPRNPGRPIPYNERQLRFD